MNFTSFRMAWVEWMDGRMGGKAEGRGVCRKFAWFTSFWCNVHVRSWLSGGDGDGLWARVVMAREKGMRWNRMDGMGVGYKCEVLRLRGGFLLLYTTREVVGAFGSLNPRLKTNKFFFFFSKMDIEGLNVFCPVLRKTPYLYD